MDSPKFNIGDVLVPKRKSNFLMMQDGERVPERLTICCVEVLNGEHVYKSAEHNCLHRESELIERYNLVKEGSRLEKLGSAGI